MWGYDLRSGVWRESLISYHSSIAYDDLIVTVRARLPKSSETSEVCELAEVRSTYHHPYWVISGEELDERPVPDQLSEQLVSVEGVAGRWVDAGDLRPGDILLSRRGGQSTVESVETAHEQTTVYHIYVEDLHNYAVGDGEWLVHNAHLKNGVDPKASANALSGFRSQSFNINGQNVLLDKKGMKHFLDRHHPLYWDGSVKTKQSFFPKSMTPMQIKSAIGEVLRQNPTRVRDIGATGTGPMTGIVDGIRYQLGLNNGRVGQFFPL